MKKMLSIVMVVACLILSFCGCSSHDDSNKDSDIDDFYSIVDFTTAFESIGLNKEEIDNVSRVFNNIGITQISKPQEALGTGIDELQSYKAYAFGYKNVTTTFTFDKRRLCYIDFSFPDEGSKTYISITGKIKSKSYDTIGNVVMYDMLDDTTGEYDETRQGYIAKLNWQEHTITDYQ